LNVVMVDQFGLATAGDLAMTRAASDVLRRPFTRPLWRNGASRLGWKQPTRSSGTIGGQLFFTTGDSLPKRLSCSPTARANGGRRVSRTRWCRWEASRSWITGITVVLFEPDAGVVRARRACEAVGFIFARTGGQVRIGYVTPAESQGRRLKRSP
jgi:hypothetical protein